MIGATALERQVRDAGGARDVRLARILPGLPQALPANVVQLLGVDDVHGASAAGVGGYLELIDAAEPGSVAARKYFRAFRDPAIAQRQGARPAERGAGAGERRAARRRTSASAARTG